MNNNDLIKEAKSLQMIEEDRETWSKIDTLFTKLIALKDLHEFVLNELSVLLIRSMLSPRSKLSGTAVSLLEAIISSNISYDYNLFIDPLFTLCGRSNKLFVQRGEDALIGLSSKITKPLCYYKKYAQSANSNVRLCTFKSIEIYLRDNQNEEILKIAEKGVNDASYACRVICKKILQEKGTEVEIKEDDKIITIRKPIIPAKEIKKDSFFASIPRKFKASIDTIKNCSPFRKHVKTNDEKVVKINDFEIKNKQEEIKKLVKLTETPVQPNTNSLTPRKLQDYINKYKKLFYFDKKFLGDKKEDKDNENMVKNMEQGVEEKNNLNKISELIIPKENDVNGENQNIITKMDLDEISMNLKIDSTNDKQSNENEIQQITNIESNDDVILEKENVILENETVELPNEENAICPVITTDTEKFETEIICDEISEQDKLNDLEIIAEDERHDIESNLVQPEQMPQDKDINIEENEILVDVNEPIVLESEIVHEDDIDHFNNNKESILKKPSMVKDDKMNASLSRLSLKDNLSIKNSKLEDSLQNLSIHEEPIDEQKDDFTMIGKDIFAKRENVYEDKDKI